MLYKLRDSQTWTKINSRCRTQKPSRSCAANRRGVSGSGEDIEKGEAANFQICSGRSRLHNQTLLEITYRWEAGLPVAETTDKPWPALPTKEEEMVEKILPHIYLSRDNLLRFIAPKKEGEPWE
jgi:hypothetical protein